MAEDNLEQESDNRLEELIRKVKRKKDAERRQLEIDNQKAMNEIRALESSNKYTDYNSGNNEYLGNGFSGLINEVNHRLKGKWHVVIIGTVVLAAALIAANFYVQSSNNRQKSDTKTPTKQITTTISKPDDITTKLTPSLPNNNAVDTINNYYDTAKVMQDYLTEPTTSDQNTGTSKYSNQGRSDVSSKSKNNTYNPPKPTMAAIPSSPISDHVYLMYNDKGTKIVLYLYCIEPKQDTSIFLIGEKRGEPIRKGISTEVFNKKLIDGTAEDIGYKSMSEYNSSDFKKDYKKNKKRERN